MRRTNLMPKRRVRRRMHQALLMKQHRQQQMRLRVTRLPILRIRQPRLQRRLIPVGQGVRHRVRRAQTQILQPRLIQVGQGIRRQVKQTQTQLPLKPRLELRPMIRLPPKPTQLIPQQLLKKKKKHHNRQRKTTKHPLAQMTVQPPQMAQHLQQVKTVPLQLRQILEAQKTPLHLRLLRRLKSLKSPSQRPSKKSINSKKPSTTTC